MALMVCHEASFGYEGRAVIEGLSFTVEQGDYLCIVGENGSGKSTLIRGLLRLKQPLGGAVEMGDGLKADEVGYLPQQTAVQRDFPASVFEVVLSGRQSIRGMRPFYSKEDKRAALENLERLDILNLKNKCYRELSGGQQQRTLFARALCAARKLLLLDEPAAGLDPVVTQDMYRLIKRLNEEQKLAIVMVSHDIRSAAEQATHILHLSSRQLFFGKTEAYLRTPLAEKFLGGGSHAGYSG